MGPVPEHSLLLFILLGHHFVEHLEQKSRILNKLREHRLQNRHLNHESSPVLYLVKVHLWCSIELLLDCEDFFAIEDAWTVSA